MLIAKKVYYSQLNESINSTSILVPGNNNSTYGIDVLTAEGVSNLNKKRILATKIIHNPWFNENYNKVHRLEEDSIELYNIEVIVETQFTLLHMPAEMNLIRSTNVSIPFDELGYDIKWQIFPTDAYE